MMRLDEFLARVIAARKLNANLADMSAAPGMVFQLPEEFWRREIPEAEFLIGALKAFDVYQTVCEFHEEEEGE
jgi:hypothetical protein